MALVLLDTNVLLRLSDGASADQPVATQAISHLRLRGDRSCLTAQNIVEFWAVATRPVDVNGLGWTTQRTADEIAQLLSRFQFLEDSPLMVLKRLRCRSSLTLRWCSKIVETDARRG
jgi:hypothetical protein